MQSVLSTALLTQGWGDLLLYQILEVKLLSREILSNSLSLPHSLLLIQTQLLLSPTKIVHAKYVKNCFFLCRLFTLHSVRYYLSLCVIPFLCFLIHAYPMLQSWRGRKPQLAHNISQRTNSKERTQSSKMFLLKKAA